MRSSLTTCLAAAAALALLTAAPATAADTPDRHRPERPATYLLDPVGPAADDVYPEGVAVRGDDFYVTSTTDGTIYRGDLDEPTATPFLPGGQDGRTQAVGVKVDRGTLLIAGGFTGRVWAYDLRTRELTGSWQVAQDGRPSMVNDLAVSPCGDVYVTDSQRPELYRIPAGERRTTGTQELEPFVSFEGTALTYADGFNANGVVVSRDGRYALVAQTNTATLYRVGLADGDVTAVDLGGEPVSGDGMILDGRRLRVVDWSTSPTSIATIQLGRDLTSGTLVERTVDPSFADPTTVARAGRDLLVVNSQFGVRESGGTPAPFTVSRIPLP